MGSFIRHEPWPARRGRLDTSSQCTSFCILSLRLWYGAIGVSAKERYDVVRVAMNDYFGRVSLHAKYSTSRAVLGRIYRDTPQLVYLLLCGHMRCHQAVYKVTCSVSSYPPHRHRSWALSRPGYEKLL